MTQSQHLQHQKCRPYSLSDHQIELQRIPAPSGIEGNEEADQEAKNATTLSVDKLLLTS
jgi:ribonuclease HI